MLKVVFADVMFVYLIFILGGTYIAVDEKKKRPNFVIHNVIALQIKKKISRAQVKPTC